MKKSLLLLLFAICSLASWAQTPNYDFYDNSTGQTLYYKYEGSGTAVTHPNPNHPDYWGGYTQPTGNLTIPSSVTYNGRNYPVAGIGEHAFYGCDDLTNVTIPNSVTSIGDYAFYGCTNLSHIIVPNSVTNIGMEVFRGIDTIYYRGSASGSPWSARVVITTNYTETGDPLVYESPYKTMVVGCDPAATSVTIPSSVTTIGEDAFRDCTNLTSVTIPSSVTNIETEAFRGCTGLTNVTIPSSVTYIGLGAFGGVKTVIYCGEAEDSPWGALRAGCFPIEGDFVFEDNAKTILIGYIGTGGSVTIPNTVTTIGDRAFYGCSGLTSVTIPDSVTTIGVAAFYSCSGLTSVTIPNSVTTIAENAFKNCTTLTRITIPNSVTTVGDHAFSGCTGLKMVSIGESVTQIGNFTFEGCTNVDTMYYNAKNLENTNDWFIPNHGFRPMQLDTLVIGNKVQSLPDQIFIHQSQLSSVTIPNSVKSIGNDAFSTCSNLSNINFGDSLTTIGENAFDHCNFTNITLPNSLTGIGNYAFSNCENLTSVTFGNALTCIGAWTFSVCDNLDNVTVPNSVTDIGVGAFYDGVKTVLYCGTATGAPWGAQRAYGARRDSLYYKDCGMTIVSGYVEGLTNANIPDGVTTIDSNAFKNCSTLTSVTIPPSVTTIENHAFEGCTNIDTLHYNAKNLSATSDWYNSSESNNSYGFRSMTLDTLVIGDSVKTLPYGVFYNQSALSSITIPYSVTSIGLFAFYGCSGLSTLTIPNSVTSIGSYAFSNCSGLSRITLPNSLTSIESGSFYNCSSLESVTIPNSVTEIKTYAFRECGSLTSVSIGSAVTKIGEEAFLSCTNVVTLYYNAKRLNTTGSATWDNTDNCGFRPMPLQTLVIGDSVETLPNYVFAGQANLSNIIIPNSVKTIGENAFRSNSNLTSLTIPNSVTSIGGSAFWGCHNLAHVSIPNSITTINGYTFNDCSNLQSIVIPSSVTSITSYAFDGCSNLKTVYNLSNLTFTKNSTDNGYVAKYALRVLSKDNGFTDHGTGSNTLHQISTSYTVVDEETGGETNIPRSTIPANFIYYDGVTATNASGWRANEIVLTDSQDEFNAPVDFTAAKASYSRDFTNTYRSTLYLPFSAPIPEGFEVFTFDNYDDNTRTLNFTAHTENIAAYTPYLVGYGLSKAEHTDCAITATDVRFPASMTYNYHPASSNNMTFQGATARTCMDGTNYGYSNGFFVRSGNGSDHTTHAHVNPFRAYFSFTGAPAQMPPVTLGVGFDSSPLGIETPEAPDNSTPSIRYSNDVYDLMGRLVRSDAHSLDGLPTGIYFWQGKKLLHSK